MGKKFRVNNECAFEELRGLTVVRVTGMRYRLESGRPAPYILYDYELDEIIIDYIKIMKEAVYA